MSDERVWEEASDCPHHWTVTSPCPSCQEVQIRSLQKQLDESRESLRRALNLIDELRLENQRAQVMVAKSTEMTLEAIDAVKQTRDMLRRLQGKPPVKKD